MHTVLIILLVLALIGGLPTFGFHNYGAYPSGGIGLVLIILIILMATGRF